MLHLAHGGDIYRNRIEYDFSVSINPIGVHPLVREAYLEGVGELTHYPDPDCSRLRKAIAARLGSEAYDEEDMIMGNGASELIFAATRAAAVRGGCDKKKLLLVTPGFSEYERAAQSAGLTAVHYRIGADDGFEVKDDIADMIDESICLVIICNPHNPTGRLIDDKLLDEITARCEKAGAYLMIDECFINLCEGRKSVLLTDRRMSDRLIVLRAFTKTFAVPAVRSGYIVCRNDEFVRTVRDMLPCWNLSVSAYLTSMAALDITDDYLADSLRLIRDEKQYLKQELSRLGIKVYDSDANFFLVRTDRDLKTQLMRAGLLIRSFEDNALKNIYRISVGSRQANQVLINAVEEIVNG